MQITIARFVLVGLCAITVACRPDPHAPEPSGPAPEAFNVRFRADLAAVAADPRVAWRWDPSFLLMHIPPSAACASRWFRVRDAKPAPCGSIDFALSLYTAWDSDYWYLDFEVSDYDPTAAGSAAPAYAGDALEIFFAGTDTEFDDDYSALVRSPRRPNQAAFFQLVVPLPSDAPGPTYVLPEFRTDKPLLERLPPTLTSNPWRADRRWGARLRVPLAALETVVGVALRGGQPLRMNVDYLDYDQTAAPVAAPVFGYRPNNVFCLDAAEHNVNVPRHMRAVYFR